MKTKKRVVEIIESVEIIDNGFEDILELAMKCKFPNCTHTTEPECAVKKSISEGLLSEERFNSYYIAKKEAEYVSEQKNKTKAIDYMKQKRLFQRS